MTTEMKRITSIIEKGASSAMSLEDIILLEVKEWMNSIDRELMLVGHRYYAGDSDILQRKRMVVGEGGQLEEAKNIANNKLVHNFVRKLVDQKVGYLLSKSISIHTDNEEYLDQLSKLFGRSFQRTFQNIGKEAINKGKAWLHVYYDENGELSFKQIPSEEIIPLWKDAAHTELDALIRVYDVESYEGKQKKIVTKVEFWDVNGVKRYVKDKEELIPDVEEGIESNHFIAIDSEGKEKGYNWDRIPFICFKYNNEELPLIKFVKSLIDDYDKQKSDNANNLEDLPSGGIYVIKNYDGADLGEFRHNLSVYRAVKVTDEGGIDYIYTKIDTEAFRTHMEMMRKDIYENGRGVDTQSDTFGGDKTGIALKFLYADLDMDANIIETEFQASLEQLRWFIDTHITNTTGKDYSDLNVDFIFDRDILINESDAIANARNSKGIISDETVVANHPWVTNVQDELDRLKQQREDDLSRFAGYQDLGPLDGNEEE